MLLREDAAADRRRSEPEQARQERIVRKVEFRRRSAEIRAGRFIDAIRAGPDGISQVAHDTKLDMIA